jgi:hypothetical protein
VGDRERVEARHQRHPGEPHVVEGPHGGLHGPLPIGLEVGLARDVLDLDVHRDPPRTQAQDLVEGGHRGGRPVTEGDPQPLELFEREIADQAVPVRRARDVRIVHHHGDAVRGDPHVELHGVRTLLDRALEGQQRVLCLPG